ncbi:MAG: uracil-DNA glycosylase [Nitrospirota bacterium]|nr:uracil-DNA glycosylase [Nitrospirota bacterium]
MTDNRTDLQEIITDIRGHVEFQRSLGIKTIEMTTGQDNPVSVHPPADRMPAAAPDGPVVPVPAQTSVARTGEHEQLASGAPQTLDTVKAEIGDCTRCKLSKGRSTIVFGEGNPKAEILFIGEGPGFEEDQQGRPFVGAAGQLLTDIIVKGMKLRREDVYICNIVKCRPPDNRNPEPDEVDACIGFVKQQIAAIKPRVIVTLGNVPTQNLLGTKQGITKVRGIWQEYDGIPVMPTFHPSYLLRSPGEKKLAWEDIKMVMTKLGLPLDGQGAGGK